MFENENTFIRMQKAGKEAEFEKLYEAALVEAEKYLNKEYPNIIDIDVKEEKKIKDIFRDTCFMHHSYCQVGNKRNVA